MYWTELRDNKTMDCLNVFVCLMCGEIVEPTVAANQAGSTADKPLKPMEYAKQTLPHKVQPERNY
jgi:hypothetical protein